MPDFRAKLVAAGEGDAWIGTAKRAETRADRIAKTVGMVLAGRRKPSQ